MMKLLELFDIPGVWALWRTRPGAGAGAPSIGAQPPKAETGAKSNVLGIGKTDEALAFDAIADALMDNALVSREEAAAFLRNIAKLSLQECISLERTFGIDEQEREFVEETTEKDAKGKDVKKKKSHKEVMNFRGKRMAVNICKMSLIDEVAALNFMKSMGATRTTGDIWKDHFENAKKLLEKYELSDTRVVASIGKTGNKLASFLGWAIIPLLSWAILITILPSNKNGSEVVIATVIVLLGIALAAIRKFFWRKN
ncbi:MAG: hypothetical protein WBC29_00195 [Candidatus Moraniibacteriota bacterium]